MRYYELVKDVDLWALATAMKYSDGSELDDVWAFSFCRRVEVARPVPIEILDPTDNRSADFNDTLYGAIVIRLWVGDLLRSFRPALEAQFLPAEITGATGDWEVLNILSAVNCMDRQRSKITGYHPENHPQAFKRGKPSSVVKLIVDPERAAGHDLFRVADWQVAVIASQRLKDFMEDANVTGIQYWPVTE